MIISKSTATSCMSRAWLTEQGQGYPNGMNAIVACWKPKHVPGQREVSQIKYLGRPRACVALPSAHRRALVSGGEMSAVCID